MCSVGTREAAFVYSISSAGVAYSITRACSLGHLSTCACDPNRKGRGRDKQGNPFQWGGCSDDVNYGQKFAKMFIDAKEKQHMDARALMNLHNNKAGRQVKHSCRYSVALKDLNRTLVGYMILRCIHTLLCPLNRCDDWSLSAQNKK
ncbi:hypothetical protein DPMN_122448 [Dreissena polymorpha]|uniref:Protein Wnt n=1 Tax=Dreissena polymorpha TaxID=45954 RepID=A0A9D4JQE3_DREPO|nr:hypothetical protein DPMN_122448 [Dreissena polymorpha]